MHAIKGASEMLELACLSQVTSYIQEMLGKMVVDQARWSQHTQRAYAMPSTSLSNTWDTGCLTKAVRGYA